MSPSDDSHASGTPSLAADLTPRAPSSEVFPTTRCSSLRLSPNSWSRRRNWMLGFRVGLIKSVAAEGHRLDQNYLRCVASPLARTRSRSTGLPARRPTGRTRSTWFSTSLTVSRPSRARPLPQTSHRGPQPRDRLSASHIARLTDDESHIYPLTFNRRFRVAAQLPEAR